MEQINHTPDRKELRTFGLIFAGMFIVFFALLLPWIWDVPSPLWAWLVAAAFASVALVYPPLLSPAYKLWMKIGVVLGWINTRIILGIVFFVLFAPVSLIFRIFSHDPMQRKLDNSAKTYRKPSTHLPRERMEKPF